MTESNDTILVTGGAGYIGSHTCKALSAVGFRPVAYDSLERGHRDAVRWGELEVGDILDTGRLEAIMARHQPAAVIHFAAYAYVGESVARPGMYYRNNVGGSVNLLEAMLSKGIDKIVFSSSCATYGVPDRLPIDEATPQQPINAYGSSKLFVEKVLRDYTVAADVRWTALRYFNAAGADADGEIGENHDPETHLVPLAILAAMGKAPPLRVFGGDYDTPDGTCVRDYVHVADLAQAHVQAVRRLLGGAQPVALNLGTGRGHSVMEIIEAVSRVTGAVVPHSIEPRRPGDPPILVANADRARQELDWTPQHSDLANIVETARAWFARQA